MSPRRQLGFATAFTARQFADNIIACASKRRCEVMVDDILWYAETTLQDGAVAQAVNDVRAGGARTSAPPATGQCHQRHVGQLRGRLPRFRARRRQVRGRGA